MRCSPTARRTSSWTARADVTQLARRRRATGMRSAAIVAALVGLLALVVSGYTAYIQRQQVRAQVWPWLVAGNNDLEHSLEVLNKGAGPAIVRSVQVFVDGKPQPTWDAVLDALGMPQAALVSAVDDQSERADAGRARHDHQVSRGGRLEAFSRRGDETRLR